MNNFLRTSFIAISLIFVFGALSVPKTNAQLNRVLKRMERRYKKLKSLQTEVILEKYNSQLGETDKMEGTAIFLPSKGMNMSVRVDWATPRVESFSLIDKQYVLYRPGLKLAYLGDIKKASKRPSIANDPLAFMNMSVAEMKATYDLKYLGLEKLVNGRKVWHLELTPKFALPYKKADIWVDKKGMPLQVKVVDRNADTTTVLLVKPKKNVKLKDAYFKIIMPKDTKIVKG
jgi:outer membrane lipoprotein-sorting protein